MKYTSMSFSSFLVFVMCIIPAVVVHGGKEDDDGKTLQISAAEPDLEEGTILITGTKFSLDADFYGTVQVFFPPENGPADLRVISFDSLRGSLKSRSFGNSGEHEPSPDIS